MFNFWYPGVTLTGETEYENYGQGPKGPGHDCHVQRKDLFGQNLAKSLFHDKIL